MQPSAELSPLERGQCWTRVCTGRRYLATELAASPWLFGTRDLLSPFRAEPASWLAIEALEANVLLPGSDDRGFPAYPDVSLIHRSHPWDFAGAAHLYPNLDCRSGRAFGDGHGFCNLARCQFRQGHPVRFACHSSELIMSAGVRLALLTLPYLAQAPEYFVEVQPVEPRDRKVRPDGKEKRPWTQALPHVILLDPMRVGEYRERESASAGNGHGTHASPRPHKRRGHWATLQAARLSRNPDGTPRRVWVRQAWVGERAWTFEGQQYCVLEPRARRDDRS